MLVIGNLVIFLSSLTDRCIYLLLCSFSFVAEVKTFMLLETYFRDN